MWADLHPGQLGDIDDWKTAETRWRAEPTASDEELTGWLSARQQPWTCSREGCSRIFTNTNLIVSLSRRDWVKVLLRETRRACEILSSATSYRRLPVSWLQSMLSRVTDNMYESSDATEVRGDLVPYDLVARAPCKPDEAPYDVFFMVELLRPNLSGPFAELWFGRLNEPFVRNGGEGRIAIDLDTGRIEAAIRRDARTEAVVATGDAAVPRPWVVGYGVRRGNARGEKDRAPEWGPTGEQHTLFDRPATLVNAVDWLLDLDRRVLNERRQYGLGGEDGGPRVHAATWQSVERALRALLGITALEPEERHVVVTHPELGRVRLDALSDGYLTTTGWVIDLIARWIQRQEDLGEAVGRDLLRQMTGVVLIDEIDLHLHPRWQLRIIDDVRRLFPRLSFVITTHNPLTLQGARPGEIFIMRRGDAGRIELCQQDIQPGHDVDRVLFEQFGIEYTFDKQTRELLRRHRELLQRGVQADEPERAGLEVELATRLGRVGEVLVDERGHIEDPTRLWDQGDRALLERFHKGKA